MPFKRSETASLLVIVSLATPLTAITAQVRRSHDSITLAQAELTIRQILNAYVQNRAETLLNPFVDVLANYWAFKAVLMPHDCGAYRQAILPSLIEPLTNQSLSVQ